MNVDARYEDTMGDDAMHRPTPEFRDYLEDEIAHAVRRHRGMRRFRIAAIVLVSVALGSSGGLAAAQMRDGARKDSLLTAANAELAMVAVQLDLARAVLADAAAKVKAGILPPASVAQAEAVLRSTEAEAMRARLRIEEVSASAQAPRDELSAPLIGGRDFVSERIRLDLFAAQQQLTAAERLLAEAERRALVGADGELPRLEAELAVARAKAVLGTLAERQALRKEFVEKGTPGDQLVRRLRRAELRHEAYASQQAVRLATERFSRLERRRAVGGVDEISVLRAQLELREAQLELQQIVRQLQRLDRAGPGA